MVRRSYIFDVGMAMLGVIPVDKMAHPFMCLTYGIEPAGTGNVVWIIS